MTMSDPRLADLALLSLAAVRARRRQQVPDWPNTVRPLCAPPGRQSPAQARPMGPARPGHVERPGQTPGRGAASQREHQMALDPRLTSLELLTIAARRAKERQHGAPRRTVTLRVVYGDERGMEPLLEGPTYVYEATQGGAAWRLMAD